MRTITQSVTQPGLEIRRQLYGAGTWLSWHDHQAPEFCLMLRGQFTETLQREVFNYQEFGVSFKPGGIHHQVQAGRHGADCLVVSLRCDGEPRDFPLPGEPSLVYHPRIAMIGVALLGELTAPDDSSPLVVEGLTRAIAGTFGARNHRRRDPKARWLQRAVARMEDQLGSAVSLRELAGQAGVSPSCLSQGFRRELGCTPGEYLRKARIRRATELLLHTTMALSEVALRAGFCDQSHFTRSFRRIAGVTPAALRRSLRTT